MIKSVGCGMLGHGFKAHFCLWICKCVDQKGSGAMLATSKLAGTNPVHAGDKAHKQGIQTGFEMQGKYHQKSKQEYQWPYTKWICLPQI